ncbi:glycoside hydrolase family 55 protein, partial [Apiospora kogelbergensis]|uniref:glycoside hydrolase family 55 protein n=1 Tax=Apiospora kogelbergensis TaxID=1337665 RepID=UPI0031302DE3
DSTSTKLGSDECPALTSVMPQGCNAGSLMMHITEGAAGYFENMWLWIADHMTDLLIESTNPVWPYGTASEHAFFYQYNIYNARNIFAGLLQTESPYIQPTPPPPAPFKGVLGKLPGDPDYTCTAGDEFNGCDESWSINIRRSANIFVVGAGLYT